MEKELNYLSNQMLRSWFIDNEIKDFKYYELYSKVNKLHRNISIIRSEYVKDLELASIMNFIERRFDLPILKENIKEWLDKDNNNEFILTVYNKISNLRSL